ncbi:MAG: DUF302 domain-containing protein [Acidobacteria bacterium]|nr:DUF302 domain-containing protein [Acidobacteriota bacterium]
MSNDRSTTRYVLEEPYEKALKLLRAELVNCELRIPVEMDVSDTIREGLGLHLNPCRVLYVCCPWYLLQAAVVDRSATGIVPLRIVVWERGEQTVVRLLDSADAEDGGLDSRVSVLANTLMSRVQQIVERIGAPQLV